MLGACSPTHPKKEPAQPTPQQSPFHVEDVSAICEAPLFSPPKVTINKGAWDLIAYAEVGTVSEAYYMRSRIRFPEWPGGTSGVTWGIGYDSGYNTPSAVLRDWHKISEVERLASVAGYKGQQARARLTTVNDILIPWKTAVEVFDNTTIPRFYQLMLRTFPGAERLDMDAQGALTSMIYNRGGSLVGDSRVDLRTIAKLVPRKDYKGIAGALRNMNVTMGPTWRRQGVYEGLSKRREAEAKMVEACIK